MILDQNTEIRNGEFVEKVWLVPVVTKNKNTTSEMMTPGVRKIFDDAGKNRKHGLRASAMKGNPEFMRKFADPENIAFFSLYRL